MSCGRALRLLPLIPRRAISAAAAAAPHASIAARLRYSMHARPPASMARLALCTPVSPSSNLHTASTQSSTFSSSSSASSAEHQSPSSESGTESTAGAGAHAGPDEEDQNEGDSVRELVLSHALACVEEHGWSDEALAAGAMQAGLPAVTKGMFPRGPAHLVEALLQQALPKIESLASSPVFQEASLSERVTMLFWARMEVIAPHSHNWEVPMALLALPHNVPHSLAQLAAFVDRACMLAGDGQAASQFWMRRASLALVIVSAEMHMLEDESPDHAATRAFLQRGINTALELEQFAPLVEGLLARVYDVAQQGRGKM